MTGPGKMKNFKEKPTLFDSLKYEIMVLGNLDSQYLEWNNVHEIEKKDINGRFDITSFSCTVDQAGLLGIIRKLNSLGLPIVSVNLLET